MKNSKKIYNTVYYVVLIIVCIVICFYFNKKEGFHEDEMFSYGSSNYQKDNVFQPYGEKDYINNAIDRTIFSSENPLKNIIYYITNPKIFIEELDYEQSQEKPVWKTKEEALDYITIQKEEVFNFFSVFYNQARDAHPPLFYYIVHIVSSLCCGVFSKYIIFIINISAFIGVNIFLKKILEQLNKSYLVIPSLILYGLSIGGISTVIFQRMYMLLTFFITLYTYLNIKIIKGNFEIDRKDKIRLGIVTILGFLTQYYFCIYALFMFLIMEIIIYVKFGKEKCFKLFKFYIELALIGLLIFPASIYHIFFSYRGISAISIQFGLKEFLNLIFNSFGLNFAIGIITTIISVIIVILKIKKDKDVIPVILLFTISGFIIIISKLSPYLDLRYVMGVLPIIVLLFLLIINCFIKKNKIKYTAFLTIIITLFSINVLTKKEPLYLYKGYNKNIEIAKENSNIKFIYIEDNGFNHIQSMPEFIIYKNSIILNTKKGELIYLENNELLQKEQEFIVSIKQYMNVVDIINQIKELTRFEHYEILIDENSTTGNNVYKFYK